LSQWSTHRTEGRLQACSPGTASKPTHNVSGSIRCPCVWDSSAPALACQRHETSPEHGDRRLIMCRGVSHRPQSGRPPAARRTATSLVGSNRNSHFIGTRSAVMPLLTPLRSPRQTHAAGVHRHPAPRTSGSRNQETFPFHRHPVPNRAFSIAYSYFIAAGAPSRHRVVLQPQSAFHRHPHLPTPRKMTIPYNDPISSAPAAVRLRTSLGSPAVRPKVQAIPISSAPARSPVFARRSRVHRHPRSGPDPIRSFDNTCPASL
jgi:hypothetical protein